MPQLDDGTIVPHYFGMEPIGVTHGNSGLKTNMSLRVGEVKSIVYPDDKKSVSKTWIEYSVEVQHKDGNLPGTVTTYPNCWVVNSFGGAADKSTYTLRPATGSSDNAGLGNGSKVLIMCINGEQNNGIILGGVRNKTEKSDLKSDGHHLFWSFNGVTAQVNDTGELTVAFSGATNADGTPRSDVTEGAAGSTFKMSNDGSVTVSQGDQTVIVDTPNKRVEITSGGYTTRIDGSGTKLGADAAVDQIIKGTTYRLAQQTLHTTLMGLLTSLSSMIAAAASTTAAAAIGVTSAAIPNAIPMVGGAIALPFFTAAGVALTSTSAIFGTMATVVSSMMTAIQTFEAQAAQYLSEQNYTS